MLMKPDQLSLHSLARLIAAILALSALASTAIAASPQRGAPSAANATANTAPEPKDGLRDIRPPIHIPAPFPWAWWSASALAAGALGIGLWKLMSRSHSKAPYEIALERLEKMRSLMRPETTRLFSQAVSEVVRRFIEQSVSVRAAHRTTDEFLRELMILPGGPLDVHRDALADFLRHCDLAKFARWILSKEQMEAMLQSARAFVLAVGTQPRPQVSAIKSRPTGAASAHHPPLPVS